MVVWKVCVDTPQANVDQQWDPWINGGHSGFIVDGKKFLVSFSLPLSLLPCMNSLNWKYLALVGGISMVLPYSK